MARSSRTEKLDWLLALVDLTPDDQCREWPWTKSAKGYGQLWWDGRVRYVGHLVLSWTGRQRPTTQHQQLHSCDNPPCVAPWHLSWGTNLQNHKDSASRGRSSRGERRPLAKLTEDAVLHIRNSGRTLNDLAEEYDVSMTTIQKARTGQTWRHVGDGGEVGVVIEDGGVKS